MSLFHQVYCAKYTCFASDLNYFNVAQSTEYHMGHRLYSKSWQDPFFNSLLFFFLVVIMVFVAYAGRPFRLPGILVGDGRLGGISGTISAYESLKLRGYDIAAVVFEDHGLINEMPLLSYLRNR